MNHHQTIKPRAETRILHLSSMSGPLQVVRVHGAGITCYGYNLDPTLKLWRKVFHQRQTTGTIPWSNCNHE